MKLLIATLLCLSTASTWSQSTPASHIIVITTDGFRWQELFGGMDTALANNRDFNEGDSSYIYEQYGGSTPEERRKKLLPFLWSNIQERGIIYGNRHYGNNVNTANRYWFSYPGYNEIMTGYPDTAINSNGYPPNPHVTVLEYLNKQPKFKGKVAAFGAWEAFNRILNEERSGHPVIASFDHFGGNKPNANEQLLNKMLDDSYKPFLQGECLDVFTHYGALEHLKTKKPSVLYIAYGETDEWAHSGKYRSYLDAARQVDAWIKQIWDYVQSDPYYHNKTTILITTDHGRGDINKKQWRDHGGDVPGASEIWIAAIGPNIKKGGEQKNEAQLYQEQVAQTIANILGITFKADHPIAKPISGLIK